MKNYGLVQNNHISPFVFSMGPPINNFKTKGKEENENLPPVPLGSHLKVL